MNHQKRFIFSAVIIIVIVAAGSVYYYSQKAGFVKEIVKNDVKIQPMVGGDRDAHGCIGSAGYSWDEQKQECVRPWEEKAATSSVPVSDSTSITVVSPNGGEDWNMADKKEIFWQSTLSPKTMVDIFLVNIDYKEICQGYWSIGSDCPQAPADMIKSNIANSGKYNWTVSSINPDSRGLKNAYDGRYVVRVCQHAEPNSKICGQSKSFFTIKTIFN